MAAWPGLDELKQWVDVTSEDWDGDGDGTRFTKALAAAIRRVKVDVAGSEDSFDEDPGDPTSNLAQAALRMAELLITRPGEPQALGRDPTYAALLKGSRRTFGVS